jgi:molecular chaperone GrpE
MSEKDINREEELNEETEINENTSESEDTKEMSKEKDNEPKEPTLEEKYNELNDKYLRLYSDFDNYRKRTIKEKADIISSASADLMGELLTVLDDFERAIENNVKTDDVEVVKEGFNLIHDKFSNILKNKGLEHIEVKGHTFDPEKHEAITKIPAQTEEDKGKVMDCVEKGYNLKGKPLRFPKVVVGH